MKRIPAIERRRPIVQRVAWVASIAVGWVCAPSFARADITKVQCVDANVSAQDLRRAGKLSQAREPLRQCAAASCPSLVREDCTRRLDELEKAQPTIVFEVKDSAGEDISAVNVTVDGEPLTDTLEGKPLLVDPGKHVFTFTVSGRAPITRALVLTEGEKGRRERIVVEGTTGSRHAPGSAEGSAANATPAAGDQGSAAPTSTGGGMRAQKVFGLVAGGLGVVGLGIGTAFGLMSESSWSSVKNVCGGDPQHCKDVPQAQPDRTTALNDATISTIGFIAGGALVAAGAVLFVTGGSRETEAPASLAVAPVVGASQAGIVMIGAF